MTPLDRVQWFAWGAYNAACLWWGASWLLDRLAARREARRTQLEAVRRAMFERLARAALQEVQLMELLRFKLYSSVNEHKLDALVQVGTAAHAQLLAETIEEVDAT